MGEDGQPLHIGYAPHRIFQTLRGERERVWVDVPKYNEQALRMYRHLGFVLEGHLRKTHRKNDERYDSIAMGLLTGEYSRRRARLMSGTPG